MIKKYLNGLAALVLVAVTAGCVSESDNSLTQDDYTRNAENALGVSIKRTNWNMAKLATTNITVNKNYGETYTVTVYSNNPITSEKGIVLAKGEVENGATFNEKITYPQGAQYLFVGITDSKGYTSYKQAKVENGVISAAFGSGTRAAGQRRTITVATAGVPYTAAQINEQLEKSKEPNSENINDNYDNTTYAINYGEGGPNNIDWDNAELVAERTYFFSLPWDEQIAYALAHHPTWLTYTADETFVRNFKITGSWSGQIPVVATEGLTDGVENGNQRTVVVTGTWNLTEDQRVGSLGTIIIAEGGTLNLSNNATLQCVNEGRLVVMPGGKITGDGNVLFANGTGERYGYNGGTIEISGTFNNNGGDMFNYGTLTANDLQGGAGNSAYYNHGIIKTHQSSSSNTRLYNNCQFYCETDARFRIVEMAQGSYLYVKGQLMPFGSEDGTGSGDENHAGVTLDNGAYVKAGTLWNGATWTGPSEGAAVVEIGQVTYLNWDEATGDGYFNGNLYLDVAVQDNAVDGKAGQRTFESEFVNVNGGDVEFVQSGGADIVIPADGDFKEGESGCTPGYTGKIINKEEEPQIWSFAFEDSFMGDYDMNDVVLQVKENANNSDQLDVTLMCTGASYNLYVYFGATMLFGGEVHAAMGGTPTKFINTGSGSEKFETKATVTTTINKPANFTFATADFWIKSPEGDIHVSRDKDPHGIVVPGDWQWPAEWQRITKAYPKFANFAAGEDGYDEWYK